MSGRAWSYVDERLGRRATSASADLVPECDQLMLAFTLAPLIDPLLTISQAAELRHLTAPIYGQLESNPDFENLGTVMPEVLRAAVVGDRATTHAYVYTPSSARRDRPNPVLIFFHGSGGNLKAYLWILSSLAEAEGCIVVAPSGGMGNWNGTASSDALELALRAAAARVPIDPARVHLMGLSNGGRALSELAAARGAEFASLTFISPVFERSAIESQSFADFCRGMRIEVASGVLDDRVPASYVEECVRSMRRSGADVRHRLISGADHFLMFSHREEVVRCAQDAMHRSE